MSGFSSEMKLRVDEDGLIGTSVNPKPHSSGDPLIETALSVIFEVDLYGKSADIDFILARIEAIKDCQLLSGSFDKNPGRPDQITHDDLVGAASLTRVVSSPVTLPLATGLVRLGEKNFWDLGNTATPYWEGFAKPWDIAFYKICAGKTPSWLELLSLIGKVLASTCAMALGKTNPNGDRLTWLRIRASEGASHSLDFVALLWRIAARRAYVTPGFMMAWYYEDEAHPYARWGHQLNF